MTPRPRTVAIIQARMGSTRLPGKVLAELDGHTLLWHVIARSRAAGLVDEVVVATTDDPVDDVLAREAVEYGVPVFRGSPEDVLDRYVQCAREFAAEIVVRITADDPLKDPKLIDDVVRAVARDGAIDYASNFVRPTFPVGLDVEAVRMRALEEAWRDADEPQDREHVTRFIWRQPDRFVLMSLEHPVDLSHHRWTVDYDADLYFLRWVFRHLEAGTMDWRKVLRLVEEYGIGSAGDKPT